jgi:transcriptional regulator with XRE-family HTH domain
MSTIGKNIKRLRQVKGISQDKLSKLADVSLQTIVKMELDDKPNPTIETVQKIAKALDISIDDLMKT